MKKNQYLLIVLVLFLSFSCGQQQNGSSNALIPATGNNDLLTYAEQESIFYEYYKTDDADITGPQHGNALVGSLKYGPDFEHFDYVNPDAPKGGNITLSWSSNFDSLNPFIIEGTSAPGSGFIFETLMESPSDEPSSQYGLIAETMEIAEDNTWVAYNLREEARWHDGTPVTSEDVVFSFNKLTTEGLPRYADYYADVVRAEAEGLNRVVFYFKDGSNPELPHIMGQLYILCKHYYDQKPFNETSEEPPIGSGPYRLKDINMGKTITYELDPNYWGRNLPINTGRYNFGTITYIVYLDNNIRFQGFKAGEYDIIAENISKRWATEYTGQDFDNGNIIKALVPDESPEGMQCYLFNLRKDIFTDIRVREAISLAFDFEWTNKNLFYGSYTRTKSVYENSIFASYLVGLPDQLELEYLEPLRDMIPEEVFTEVYQPPATDGTGNNRTNLQKAIDLLEEAGWIIEDTKLINSDSGQQMNFEIMLVSPSFERVMAPFTQNLEKLGINATYRTVDSAQYIKRRDEYDFDMMVTTWPQSFSPGNEQRYFWGSEAADINGNYNFAGIKNPAVDILIEKIIEAEDFEHLKASVRALDRVLLWNHYVVPNWYIKYARVAYWNKFGRPDEDPDFGVPYVSTWWIDTSLELNN